MMYITALSYGLVRAGIIIRQDAAGKPNKLLFAGGFIAALGWVSKYVNLIHFYIQSLFIADWCPCSLAMV